MRGHAVVSVLIATERLIFDGATETIHGNLPLVDAPGNGLTL